MSAIVQFFKDAWNKIQEAWAAAQPYFEMIKEGIKTAFSVVVEILTAPFRIAWFLITSIWDIATTYFQNVWIGIQTVFSVVGQIIGGFFESAWIIIKGVWDVVVLYFQTIWSNIQAVFSVVATVLGGFFQVAWTTITTIWDVATGYFQMIWSVIQGIFSVVQSVLSGDFSGAWEAGMVRDSEYFRICRKLVRINLSVSMERGSKCLFKLGIILFWLVGHYPKHIFKSGNVYRERDRRRGKIRDQWRNIYDSKHGQFRDQNYQWSN